MKFKYLFFGLVFFLSFFFINFAQACTPGTYQCSADGGVLFCNQQGEWVLSFFCGAGTNCVCQNNLCDCIPSTTCNQQAQQCSFSRTFSLICSNNQWTINQVCPQNSCSCFNNTCSCQQSQICTPFRIRCKPGQEGTSIIQVCSSDGTRWIDSFCPGDNQICQGDVCVNTTRVVCVEGSFFCDTLNGKSMLYKCQNNEFVLVEDCKYLNLVCDSSQGKCVCPQNSQDPICLNSETLTYCQNSNEGGEWFRKTCTLGYCRDGQCYCNQGSKYCKDDRVYYFCSEQNQWVELSCPVNTNCIGAGECVECFSFDGDYSVCLDNTTIGICKDKKFFIETCPKGTTCTVVNENFAACEGTGTPVEQKPPQDQSSSSSSTSSQSSGSSSRVSGGSGGGEITRTCYRWSDWFINKTEEQIDKTSPSLVCINTTYVRWCKTSKGELDFSIFEKKYDYKCGQKDQKEICNYEYVGSSTYIDYINGECRTCSKDIAIYTCYPSGKKDQTKQKTSVSCGLWRTCTEEEKAKFEKTIEKQPPYQVQSEFLVALNKAFEQYGGFGLLLIFLLISGFAFYLFWKFYGEGKKKEDEGVQ